MKQDLEAAQKELTEVKKESHKRKKMLVAQQQLMYAGNESYNKVINLKLIFPLYW